MSDGNSIWIGALARLDIIEGNTATYTFCFNSYLSIHKTNLRDADMCYHMHRTSTLYPDDHKLDLDKFNTVEYEYDLRGYDKPS